MKKIWCLAIMALAFAGCKKSDDMTQSYLGYVYTSTNSSTGNAIIAVVRKSDGTLQELPNSPYSTGANGDAAEGDFDT